MQFLVNGSWIEVGILLAPNQAAGMLEQVVVPSLEMLAGWEEQGKIKGGVFAGERETTFVVEAASSEELGQLLTSLPFWGMMKWHVRPFQSFRSTVERENAVRQQIHANVGGGQ